MSQSPTPLQGELEFHFEKSGLFRVIHVDGVVGSIAPGTALIHMSVFSERAPVPQLIVHQVSSGGVLGPEITERRIAKSGLFREVEADLVITVETAMAVRAWLDDRIQELNKLRAQRKNGAVEDTKE